jgi:hypothetical protein
MLEASFTFQSYVERLTDAQLEALLFDAHAEEIKRHEQANRQTTGDPRRRWLPKALVLLALSLPLAGCSGFVAEYKLLEAFAKSPNVSYANVDAWRCDLAKSTTSKGAVEDCGVCINVSPTSQGVVINGQASQVEPGGTVLRCSDRAWVRDPTMPPIAATTSSTSKPPAAQVKR